MQLSEYLDNDLLLENLLLGYVKLQKHPTLPLCILNYTNKTQFDNAWDDVTRKCRGLIYHAETEEIVARPFEKFFNADQQGAPDYTKWLDTADLRIQDKMDGSLGIIYPTPDGPAVATRGSFTSEQALWATDFLRKKYPDILLREDVTYLVEIIYPSNRIVLDYGDMSDLVLLDVLRNKDGKSLLEEDQHFLDFPVTRRFYSTNLASPRDNAEGYVLTNLATNERVKIKFEEYKRLHKIITGVSSRTIWELLKNENSLETLLDLVPDEFYDWVTEQVHHFNEEAEAICREVEREFAAIISSDVPRNTTDPKALRKEFALKAKDSEYTGLLFSMYNDRPIREQVFNLLKPSHAKPFWNENE